MIEREYLRGFIGLKRVGQRREVVHSAGIEPVGYGKFSRSFQLPENINEEKIDAKHQNGILSISVMKDPKSIVKKTIKIK